MLFFVKNSRFQKNAKSVTNFLLWSALLWENRGATVGFCWRECVGTRTDSHFQVENSTTKVEQLRFILYQFFILNKCFNFQLDDAVWPDRWQKWTRLRLYRLYLQRACLWHNIYFILYYYKLLFLLRVSLTIFLRSQTLKIFVCKKSITHFVHNHEKNETTTLIIIFWQFTLFQYNFDLAQVKRNLLYFMGNFTYD